MSLLHSLSSIAVALSGCALDVPPAEPTFDDGRPAVTLYQVQDPTADGHPDVGTNVRVEDLVVTAVDRFDEDGSGKTGTVFVQEIDGGPWSGIQLYRPAVQPASEYLLPGDVVEVEGQYVEFDLGQINPAWADATGRTISQVANGVVRKTGEWISPEPALIDDPADLQEDPAAESWEGVLVEMRDVDVTRARDSYGAFQVTGGALVDDDNYQIPNPAVGDHFVRVAGVSTYLAAEYKVLPRSALDVTGGPAAQE